MKSGIGLLGIHYQKIYFYHLRIILTVNREELTEYIDKYYSDEILIFEKNFNNKHILRSYSIIDNYIKVIIRINNNGYSIVEEHKILLKNFLKFLRKKKLNSIV